MDDAERLKKAAAEAMAEDIGDGSKKDELEGHEIVGTKDKEAHDMLAAAGKS